MKPNSDAAAICGFCHGICPLTLGACHGRLGKAATTACQSGEANVRGCTRAHAGNDLWRRNKIGMAARGSQQVWARSYTPCERLLLCNACACLACAERAI